MFFGINFFISVVLIVEIVFFIDDFEILNIVDINWFDILDCILRRNIFRDIVDVLLGVFFIFVFIFWCRFVKWFLEIWYKVKLL